jgi:hypothetical protein
MKAPSNLAPHSHGWLPCLCVPPGASNCRSSVAWLWLQRVRAARRRRRRRRGRRRSCYCCSTKR